MARPTRTLRIRRMVIAAAVIGQLPGLGLLTFLAGPLVAAGACALLSLPLAIRLVRGLVVDGLERGFLAAALLCFYAWWGASLFAGGVFPAAALIALGLGAGMRAAAEASLLAGAAAGIIGITWNRLRPKLVRVEIAIAGLDPALDGYRIAQLSDIHLGGHTPPSRLRRWVDRLNALEPELATVTGDLITSGDALLGEVATELGRLKARDTVALCLGNHDYFADAERLVALLERSGVEVLRNRGRVVGDGAGRYFLAGVDDTWTARDDVAAALADRPPGLPAIVLAHDPRLFDECRRHGATLVLSGHTHGGQLAVPLLARTLNVARIAYRRTAGLYRDLLPSGETIWHYVSRGAGTTGPPLRIGARAELTLITLRVGT